MTRPGSSFVALLPFLFVVGCAPWKGTYEAEIAPDPLTYLRLTLTETNGEVFIDRYEFDSPWCDFYISCPAVVSTVVPVLTATCDIKTDDLNCAWPAPTTTLVAIGEIGPDGTTMNRVAVRDPWFEPYLTHLDRVD